MRERLSSLYGGDLFSLKGRECLSLLERGEREREREGERETPSRFSIERWQTRPLWRGESVSLLERGERERERDSFSLQKRERLSSLYREGRLLLSREEGVSLSTYEEEAPPLCRGESVSLLDGGEKDSFSLQERERERASRSSVERRQIPSLYR